MAPKLEIPTLPPPSSKFILSNNSELMDRLKAFLPLIAESNAQLVPTELGAEEGVSLEEFSEEEDSEAEQEEEAIEESEESESDKGLANLFDINKPNTTKSKSKIIEIQAKDPVLES